MKPDVWMREEDRADQSKPAVYEFAVGGDMPPGGGWVPLQLMNDPDANGITSEQHEAMQSAGHTPGPWVVKPMKGYCTDQIESAHPDYAPHFPKRFVASVDGPGEHWQADGRLIAAAPDLLRLVQHMLGAIDGGHIDSEEVDGDERAGIPPHKWHEEWASIARAVVPPPVDDAPQPVHMRERLEQISRTNSLRESCPAAPSEGETTLWLWRNGDHYWAFDSLYPTRLDCDDRATLGEPVAWATLKRTKPDPSDYDPREISAAQRFCRERHPLNAGELYEALNDLLNDCINFDGGKLTRAFMKRASDVLAKSRALGTDAPT